MDAALFVGFDGLAEQVTWQVDELARILDGARTPTTLAEETWARLATAAADAFASPAAVMRLCVLPTQVAGVMEQASSIAHGRGLRCAFSSHAGVGVMTAALAMPDGHHDVQVPADVLSQWRHLARKASGYALIEMAPLAVKEAVGVWDDAGATGRIMQRIKSELDPHNVLNPGRFLGGI